MHTANEELKGPIDSKPEILLLLLLNINLIFVKLWNKDNTITVFFFLYSA